MGNLTDKGYTTLAKVASYLNVSITDSLADYILAAQKFIDDNTGRNFKADESASERLYDGNATQDLVIDDCIEVTKVEVGSNTYGDSFSEVPASGTDRYYTIPVNRKNGSDVVIPIRKLHLRSRFWVAGFQNQKITAKWGYTENPPEDIIFSATVLVAGMYQGGRAGNVGGVKSESVGEYSVSFGNEKELSDFNKVSGILGNYKKYEL